MERLVEVRSTGGLARDWPVLNCRKRGGLELSEAQCLRACGCNEGSKCYHCGFMNRAELRRLFLNHAQVFKWADVTADHQGVRWTEALFGFRHCRLPSRAPELFGTRRMPDGAGGGVGGAPEPPPAIVETTPTVAAAPPDGDEMEVRMRSTCPPRFIAHPPSPASARRAARAAQRCLTASWSVRAGRQDHGCRR